MGMAESCTIYHISEIVLFGNGSAYLTVRILTVRVGMPRMIEFEFLWLQGDQF